MHPLLAYVPNPNSPLEAVYGARDDSFTDFLGTIGAGSVHNLLDDPEIQAQMAEFQLQCKAQAKAGVTEWMGENWGLLVVGGAALVFMNYLVIVAAVLPTVRWGR